MFLLAHDAEGHHNADGLRATQIRAATMEKVSRDAGRWDRVRHWRAVRVGIKRKRAQALRAHRCIGLSSHQRHVLRVALTEARRLGASWKVRVALVAAGIVESRLRNLSYGHLDSVGFLQQRPSMGWPSPRNVRVATRSFVTRAMRIAHAYAVGPLAQAVQRSAFPARYGAVAGRAARLVRCF